MSTTHGFHRVRGRTSEPHRPPVHTGVATSRVTPGDRYPGPRLLMLRSLRSLSLILAVASLLAPAVANAASKKKPVYPTISTISPRKLMIGEKLTIKGAHLSAGKTKSSVAFYRTGKPVVFGKADSVTRTKLVVTVSTKVGALLAQRDGLS